MRKGIIYVYFNRAKYEKEGIEKYYVGQTVRTMEQRAGKDGKYYCLADSNRNTKFANSIRKWGWNAFEGRVLEEVYEEDLDELEKFYIEQFDSFKNGYNSTLGGEGARGHNPYANKTIKEIKEINEKRSNSIKKRYEDPKEREKQSKAIKKRYEDPKEREKQSKKVSGEKNGRVKSVYCKELNIIFSYIGLAEKYCKNVLNIKIGPIGAVCNGKVKSTGRLYNGTKLTWKWVEDVDQETLNNAIYIDSKRYEDPKLIKKMSEVIKKRYEEPKEREKQSKKVYGEKSCHAKKVYCKELNIIFSYVKLAEKYCKNVLNIKICLIDRVCRGIRKFTGKLADGTKLTWKYIEDVDKETLNKAEYIDSEKYEEIIKAKLNENKKIS